MNVNVNECALTPVASAWAELTPSKTHSTHRPETHVNISGPALSPCWHTYIPSRHIESTRETSVFNETQSPGHSALTEQGFLWGELVLFLWPWRLFTSHPKGFLTPETPFEKQKKKNKMLSTSPRPVALSQPFDLHTFMTGGAAFQLLSDSNNSGSWCLLEKKSSLWSTTVDPTSV